MTDKDLTRTDDQSINAVGYIKFISISTAMVAITNPIELVKSRLQTNQEHMERGSITRPYNYILETTRRIMSEQGVGGLFKGVHHYVLRTIPASIGVFTVKELIHRKLTKFVKYGDKENSLRKSIEKHYYIVNGFAGGSAGFIIQFIIYPFEYFRVIISNETNKNPKMGIVQCVKDAMKHRGIRGIFNGVTNNVIYMASARGVYFGLFDSFKDRLSTWYYRWGWSYVCILIALIVNYPLDTIRKRVILAPHKFINGRECLKHIIRNESLGSLYKGVNILSVQAVTMSILLYIYDQMFIDIFRKNRNQ